MISRRSRRLVKNSRSHTPRCAPRPSVADPTPPTPPTPRSHRRQPEELGASTSAATTHRASPRHDPPSPTGDRVASGAALGHGRLIGGLVSSLVRRSSGPSDGSVDFRSAPPGEQHGLHDAVRRAGRTHRVPGSGFWATGVVPPRAGWVSAVLGAATGGARRRTSLHRVGHAGLRRLASARRPSRSTPIADAAIGLLDRSGARTRRRGRAVVRRTAGPPSRTRTSGPIDRLVLADTSAASAPTAPMRRMEAATARSARCGRDAGRHGARRDRRDHGRPASAGCERDADDRGVRRASRRPGCEPRSRCLPTHDVRGPARRDRRTDARDRR